ncbi:protein shisa-4-like isoform X2 [Littorina saxatilis]|uniref:protein shisa-4-like isoform X2 n=1 Tax=Littorina saxatilis TaxID=31220 RepID=UPI0038B48106
MAVDSLLLSFFGVVLLSLTDVVDGENCIFQNGFYKSYYYCQYGCCSSRCCSYRSVSNFGTSVAVIVGCVIGAIALIAFIITAICCCIRRRGRPGQVIVTGQPGFNPAAPGVAVIQHSNTHTSAPAPSQPQYNYGMQPMGGPPGNAAFKPYAQPPPAYPGYSNAAYSTSDNPGTTPTYPPSSGGESNPGGKSGGTPGLANAGYSQPPAPGFNL